MYERFVKTNHKNFVSAAPAITYADSRSFASRGMCRVMRGTQPFQIAAIPESSRVAVMFDAMVDLRRWFDTLLLLTVDAERVGGAPAPEVAPSGPCDTNAGRRRSGAPARARRHAPDTGCGRGAPGRDRPGTRTGSQRDLRAHVTAPSLAPDSRAAVFPVALTRSFRHDARRASTAARPARAPGTDRATAFAADRSSKNRAAHCCSAAVVARCVANRSTRRSSVRKLASKRPRPGTRLAPRGRLRRWSTSAPPARCSRAARTGAVSSGICRRSSSVNWLPGCTTMVPSLLSLTVKPRASRSSSRSIGAMGTVNPPREKDVGAIEECDIVVTVRRTNLPIKQCASARTP